MRDMRELYVREALLFDEFGWHIRSVCGCNMGPEWYPLDKSDWSITNDI